MNLERYKKEFLKQYDKAFFFDGTFTTLTQYYCDFIAPVILYDEDGEKGEIFLEKINDFFVKKLEQNGHRIFLPPESEVGANIFLRRYAVYLLNENDTLFGKKGKSLIPVVLTNNNASIKDKVIASIMDLGFGYDEAISFLKKYANSIVVIIQDNNDILDSDIRVTSKNIEDISRPLNGVSLRVLAISNHLYGGQFNCSWSFKRRTDAVDLFSGLEKHLIDLYNSCKNNAPFKKPQSYTVDTPTFFIPEKACLSFAVSSFKRQVEGKATNIYQDTYNLVDGKIKIFSANESVKIGVDADIIKSDLKFYLANFATLNIFAKQKGENLCNNPDITPEGSDLLDVYPSSNSYIFDGGILNQRKVDKLLKDYFVYFRHHESVSTNFFSSAKTEMHIRYWIYYAVAFLNVENGPRFLKMLNRCGSNALFIPIIATVLLHKCFYVLKKDDAKVQARRILHAYQECKKEQCEKNKNTRILFEGKELSYQEAYYEIIKLFAQYHFHLPKDDSFYLELEPRLKEGTGKPITIVLLDLKTIKEKQES